MGGLSAIHWVLVAIVILVLFGRGRISEMMGDLGKGVSSFKKGIKEEEQRDAVRVEPARLEDRARTDPAQTVSPASPVSSDERDLTR